MRPYMLKAVTEARGADGTGFRTTNLRITCAEGRPATSIEYQREAASNEIGVSPVIHIVAGTDVKTLQRTTPIRGDDREVLIAQWPPVVTRDPALDHRSGAGTAHAPEELRRDLMESVPGLLTARVV
jgi:hypothetical protein